MRITFPSAALSIFAAGLLTAASSQAAAPSSSPQSIVLSVPSSVRVPTTSPIEPVRRLLLRSTASSQRISLRAQPVRRVGTNLVVKFQQTYQGLPVIGRGAAAAIDQSGHVRLATARLEERLPASIAPSMTATEAAAIASKRAGLPADGSNTRLVLWPTPEGAKLAYSVLPVSLLPIPYAPVVVVDASSGRILSMNNLVRTENAAKVFTFNPVKTPNQIDVTLPVATGETVMQNENIISYNCVDNHNTTQVNAGGFNVTVHICDLEQAPADGTTGDYTQYTYEKDTGGDEPFAEVSIFYHANKAFEFFQGFDPSFALTPSSTPLYTVSNLMLPAGINSMDVQKMGDPNLALVPFSNAFFSGWDQQMGQLLSQLWGDKIKGGSLMFGQGAKVDFSYDGDVVYHEFTHAVVDATIKLVGTWHLDEQGASDAPGAMNEALADYFSSAMTGDPDSGEYAGQEFGLDAIRHLDNENVCPANLAGEVHYDSQFFSASLWATRSSLTSDDDKKAFDLALYTALTTAATGDLGFEQLAQLFIEAVKQSALGQSVADELQEQFKNRGVYPVCSRTFLWNDKPISSTDDRMLNAFISAGKAMMPPLSNVPYAPGLFQVEIPIESDVTTIVASLDKLETAAGLDALNPGKPFTPAFIVNFEEPISFKVKGGFKTTAEPPVEAEKIGDTLMQAKLPVPSGATKAYVMVVNLGDKDGYYRNVQFSLESDPPDAGVADTGPADTGANNGDAGSHADSAPPSKDAGVQEQPDDEASGGGCSCRVGSPTLPSDSGLAAFALAGLLGLSLRRRRRRD